MLKDTPIKELVKMAALDGELFTSTFFPRMARQKPPIFHAALWKGLDSKARLVNYQVFRGGGKTSTLRAYTAKRISYGQAHTILYLGKSESHAIRSVNWLKNQIDTNKLWADTFSLTRGSKWQDVEMSIKHNLFNHEVWLMAMGINGSIRGINRDDFRPDLIILDDVIDDENASTSEQRTKIATRIYGAVKESLAPVSESPDAKLVMLQTPIHPEDASSLAKSDPEWVSATFPCWTPETINSPIEEQKSSWPARWSDEVLRKEKRFALQRNQASIWYREKECKLISPESCVFKPEWLQYYDSSKLPSHGIRVLVIDPVPPPSERETAMGLTQKDYECLHVIQRTNNNFYSVEYRTKKGHNPSWTIATLFELLETYNIRKILVESVAYQRTLAWLIKQAMEKQGRFWQIIEFNDTRSKFNKIVDALNGISSSHNLYIRGEQSDLISQFRDYPSVKHDDVLETLAIGCMELNKINYDNEIFTDIGEISAPEKLDLTNFYRAP